MEPCPQYPATPTGSTLASTPTPIPIPPSVYTSAIVSFYSCIYSIHSHCFYPSNDQHVHCILLYLSYPLPASHYPIYPKLYLRPPLISSPARTSIYSNYSLFIYPSNGPLLPLHLLYPLPFFLFPSWTFFVWLLCAMHIHVTIGINMKIITDIQNNGRVQK